MHHNVEQDQVHNSRQDIQQLHRLSLKNTIELDAKNRSQISSSIFIQRSTYN